jgi:sulfotransferase
MNKLFFCGGLPRTGSTVLMNILQQNPRIFTTGTCALPDLLHQQVLIKSRYREQFQAMSLEQADKAMYGLIHGATKGWFEALTNKPVVISKNRSWSNLFHLYPDSKYICMVRDLRDIIESFEKINQRTLALHSFADDNALVPAMSESEKFGYYFKSLNVLSDALANDVTRMMDVFKKNPSKVLFIRFEDFTKDPIYILKKVYNHIGEEYYSHDLENISQSVLFEHDHAYFKERADHQTAPSFQYYKEPQRTFSTRFQQEVLNNYKWFYEGFYPDAS